MKASELIKRLQELVEEHGDREVQLKYYDNYNNSWDREDVSRIYLDIDSNYILAETD